MKKIQIRCVYKTGKTYSIEYVQKLYNSIDRFSSNLPYDFVCLTDDPSVENICDVIPLKHNWPGWWSKIELFRDDLPNKYVIYFDLDTLIVNDLSKIFYLAQTIEFSGLEGFNLKYRKPGYDSFASGIMLGVFNSFSHIYHKFKSNPEKYMDGYKERWNHGDQGFISANINLDKIPRLQKLLPVNYIIGKKQFRRLNYVIPKNTSMIAWSGQPRLHEVKGLWEYEHIYSVPNKKTAY